VYTVSLKNKLQLNQQLEQVISESDGCCGMVQRYNF